MDEKTRLDEAVEDVVAQLPVLMRGGARKRLARLVDAVLAEALASARREIERAGLGSK
jgi:hypothetical protein